MYQQVKMTQRSLYKIQEIFHNSFSFENQFKCEDILQFQKDILNEIIFLENKITGYNHIIKKNKEFIQYLIESDLKSKNTLEIYNKNIKEFEGKIKKFKNQRFYFKRFADILPFTFISRDIIREWLKFPESGFISFKTGLVLESDQLIDTQKDDSITILCDITNCMRIGDLYFITQEGDGFAECKIRNTPKESVKIDLSSIKRKIAQLEDNQSKKIKANYSISNYINEITELVENSYQNPIINELFDDIFGVQIINWQCGDLGEIMKFINSFSEQISNGVYAANPGFVNQLNIESIRPIFGFGFKPKTLIDLFTKNITLMIFIDIKLLNEKLEKMGKAWRIRKDNYQEIYYINDPNNYGIIDYPWIMFLNECLTVDSFIEWNDFLITNRDFFIS